MNATMSGTATGRARLMASAAAAKRRRSMMKRSMDSSSSLKNYDNESKNKWIN